MSEVEYITLTRYVSIGKMLVLRSALEDDHPESWPSKYREITGDPIPDGWRECLRVPSEQV